MTTYQNYYSEKRIRSDLIGWRRYRAQGLKITEMQDLTAALEEYAGNIKQVVALARQRNIRLILMTQPVLWHADMPEENEALLVGFIGDPSLVADHAHYSVEVLAACMRLYNERLLQLCQ